MWHISRVTLYMLSGPPIEVSAANGQEGGPQTLSGEAEAGFKLCTEQLQCHLQANEAAASDKAQQAELAEALSSLQFQLDEAGVHAAEGQRLLEQAAAREARLQKEVQDGAAYTQEIEGE